MSDQDEKQYGAQQGEEGSGSSEQAARQEEVDRSGPQWWELRPSTETIEANEAKIEAAKAVLADRRAGGTASAEVAAAAEPGLGANVTAGDNGSGRTASISRKTNETDIKLSFNVDGTGRSEIETDVPFLNHMLDLFTKHGQFDLRVEAHGDIDIDDHHTVEDIGICLGQTLREALGDKRGIKRYASVFVPMDEALAQVIVDMSNRPHFEYRAQYPSAQVGSFSTELVHEFLWKLALEARMTLHVIVHYGHNTHHMIEAVFKALGRALDEATSIDPRVQGVPSTKGVL